MAVNEIKRYDKKYRVCTDEKTKAWDRYSFWTAGQDVHMENGDTNSDSLVTVINNINNKIASHGASKQSGNIIQENSDGLYLSAAGSVAVDPRETNILKTTADGLLAEVKLSKDSNNILEMQSDGLYAKTSISTDANNAIEKRDNGIYVSNTASKITTSETDNILVRSSKDDGLYVANPVKVSDDADNGLTYGSDNKLYVNTKINVDTSDDNILTRTSDGLYVQNPVKVADTPDNILVKNENDELYVALNYPDVSTLPENIITYNDGKLYAAYEVATAVQDGLMSAEDKLKLDGIVDPMSFKGSLGIDGTITTLPSASSKNIGYTYKVITDGTYDGKEAKIGDTFISDGKEWVLIPSGDDGGSGGGSVMSVGLNVPTGFSVSNSPITTSGNIQLSFDSGYSLPSNDKQTSWDNKQNALTSAQMNAVNSGITASLKANYDTAYAYSQEKHAPSDAQANVIETVEVNGVALTPTNKKVNIVIPASKDVDTTITSGSTSQNLPTSQAVASFVEGKGYKTTDNDTTYTFATGDGNGQIKVTPKGGVAQNVSVKGLGSLAYSSATIPTKVSDLNNDANYITSEQLPTVNNATITINQGGTQKGTFTLNGSDDVTINLDAGGGASGDYLEKTNPTGTGSLSLNRQSATTVGDNSVAIGIDCTASATGSYAEGNQTKSLGQYSHSEGHTTSTGSGAIAAHAEGWKATATGKSSHAEGGVTSASDTTNIVKASGDCSHAEGHGTTASGFAAHAENGNNTASGNRSHAEGYSTIASGDYSHTSGANTESSNASSFAMGKYNTSMTTGGSMFNTTGTAFVIGNGTSSSNKANAFSVQFDGTVKAKSTITGSTTADYAEFFEWLDENPNAEDRVGHFVTIDGDKIRIANSSDEYILGVISGQPFVLGNGDCDTWNGMYLHDEYRRTKYEPAPKMREILDDEGNPTGEYEEIPGEFEGIRPILNPDYDPTRPYISRFDRPEWAPVGMLGVLAVKHDGSAIVNGYVTVNDEGIATACDRKTENSYRVIKSNSNSVVEIIFR